MPEQPQDPKEDVFAALVAEMRGTPPPGKYYALTLTASEKGKVQYSWHSHFSGYTDNTPRRELRAASLVDPVKMLELWADIGRSGVVVAKKAHLGMYLLIGGTAVIAQDIADSSLSTILGEKEIATVGPLGIPMSIELAKPASLNHAPTRKLRMEIFKRDQFRCCVCGRRPSNNVDIELHVHHIVPWSEGGLTLRPNLITLCHTCHKGLDPHREWRLFDLIAENEPSGLPNFEMERAEYRQGVSRYRAIAAKLSQNAASSPVSKPARKPSKKR